MRDWGSRRSVHVRRNGVGLLGRLLLIKLSRSQETVRVERTKGPREAPDPVAAQSQMSKNCNTAARYEQEQMR